MAKQSCPAVRFFFLSIDHQDKCLCPLFILLIINFASTLMENTSSIWQVPLRREWVVKCVRMAKSFTSTSFFSERQKTPNACGNRFFFRTGMDKNKAESGFCEVNHQRSSIFYEFSKSNFLASGQIFLLKNETMLMKIYLKMY